MSDYSIRLLKARAVEVRELIAGKTAEEDQLSEREARLKEELAAAIRAHEETRRAGEALREELAGLHDDIARLQETKPNGAPDPGPVPEKREPRTRTPMPDLDRGIQERHEAEANPRRHPHALRDPLKVHELRAPEGKTVSPHRRTPAHEGGEDLLKLSPTERARAEVAYEILATDPGGSLPQWRWAECLTEYLACKPQTGASILSKCIRILVTEKRVIWTGEKVPVGEGGDGQRRSPVWITSEAAPAELRAAAGLGTAEDNFAGRTSRWPKASDPEPPGGRIVEEGSGFEQGKKR